MDNHEHMIYIGSTNPAKVKAVESVVKTMYPAVHVIGQSVASGVSAQPKDDVETIQGALNRCRELKKTYSNQLCIGLEGGIQDTPYGMFVTNWGALIDENMQDYIAGGVRVRLPESIALGIRNGKELGDMMDIYAHKEGVRKNEGAIGILSEGAIDRSTMFAHVVKLLFGQMKHYSASKM